MQPNTPSVDNIKAESSSICARAYHATGKSGAMVNCIHRTDNVNHNLGYLVTQYLINLNGTYISLHAINNDFDGVFYDFSIFILWFNVTI